MSSRVTDGLLYKRSQESMMRAREKMLESQEQAVTGKRVNKASDDPVAAMRGVSLKERTERAKQVGLNLDLASNVLNLTDASLGELTEVINRAKELAIQMSSTTSQSDDARVAAAQEAEQLSMRVIQIGNTRLGDRYIFGGYQTDRPPFDESGNYYGDNGEIQLELDSKQRISLNLPGIVPFFGVSELANSNIENRLDPQLKENPTVSGELREPASILAENRGVEVNERDPDFQELKTKVGVNVFASIRDFATGLKQGQNSEVHKSLDQLDAAFKQVIAARALVGAQQNMVDMGVTAQENIASASEEQASKVTDADTIKVFSDMARNENLLKVSLETNKKLITPSLLDFLK